MSDLKDPLYKYWLSYTLSLNYLKEGIYGFVNQFAKQHHSNLLQSYIKGTGSPANSCTECTSDNLLPDHPRHQCIQKFRSKCFCNNPVGRRKCPNNFCSRLYDLIVIAHDERNPLWMNTDPTKWYMDHWEIAKCYLSTPGYLEKRTAADTDTAGLLSIIENNIEIRTYVDCIDNIRKVRDVRNNIMHSKSFQVDQSSLYQYIDQMILVLKDPKILVTDAAAQNAVIKLEKLKTDQVYMSLKDAYEMERQAFKAGEDGKREIEKQHKEVFHQMEFEREEIHDNLDLDFDQRLLEQKMNIKPMAILMQTEVKEFERSYQTAEDVIELKGWQITDNSNAYFESRVKDYENKIEKQGSSTIEHDDYLFSSSWDEDTKKSGPGYDPNEWDRCIIRKSEPDANILLEREILPSKRELNRAMHVFGRNSDIFSYICSTICQRVRKLQNVVNVLPSYKEGYESIIFCVTLKKKSTFFEFEDYEYCIRCENEVSDEGDHVAEYETKDETMSQFDNTTFEKLRKCINNNADDLLKRHSNINVILPSLVKSIGYETGKPNMKQVPCIAIYVTVKGCIPLNETPFPKYIDGFPTDVLEGEYELFVKGPNEYHEHLKIGLAIHANVLNGDGILGGTLGGFIDHSKYGLCGITCAHVVYSADELIGIKDKKQFCLRKTVYQPIYDGSSAFGEVVETVYDEGSPSSSGMEVVLFSIQKRQPMDGSFPRTLNDHEAGFDASNPLCFNSGETCEINEIKRRTEVYKFGMSSGITRGSFALQGAVLHKSQMQGNSHGFDFRLMNQIVVLKIGDNSFAEPGDSGALVLIEGGHDSTAIGIVAGGMKGRVFVTPICDILRAVGCTELKMHKFTPTCTQLSTDSGVAMEVC